MRSVKWEDGRLYVLDQTKLPAMEVYRELKTYRDAGYALSDMVVRGVSLCATVIAYGMVLSMNQARNNNIESFREDVYAALDFFEKTRVSVFAQEYILKAREYIQNEFDINKISAFLKDEADAIARKDNEISAKICDFGIELISEGDHVLTYSNYGSLSSNAEGSVVALLHEAARRYGNVKVYCCETRPFLQGSRLTSWELKKKGINVTVITDNAAAHLMKTGVINKVIVGADRIALNGDIVGKIGTYMLAVCARENSVPFYVAAPSYSIDKNLQNCSDVVLEHRSLYEVASFNGSVVVPEGINISNPVCDVTEVKYIGAVVTEKGVEKNVRERGVNSVS